MMIIIAFFGFSIEVLGVKTGYIFGSYHYGNSLGFKLKSVPILIGINWAILLYCTAQFAQTKNPILNAFIGAFLMVALDFFLEQNAAKFDFWYWKNNIIPMQNYLAWFTISLTLNLIFQKQINHPANLTAKAFYIIQIVFFASLYLLK